MRGGGSERPRHKVLFGDGQAGVGESRAGTMERTRIPHNSCPQMGETQ